MPKIQAETATGLVDTEAPAGKKLVLAIEDAGIDILHRCGGNARCTTCRVEILDGDAGEMGELEQNRLAMETELEPNIRLSCQIHVQNDLKVRVVNQASVRGMDPDHDRWTNRPHVIASRVRMGVIFARNSRLTTRCHITEDLC